ncbi:MAG TPA: DUF2905 domain-containing protein [Anaerolineales bacterium]|nr:MAG: hypothetical protein A2Z37_09110 [Chloroflexi bacterium RBG_19FT_COMBO_62_14]HLE03375.1 DUF2905 domain-containing protein [Anaerolineales bacterium]
MPDLPSIGRWLIIGGLGLAAVGGLIVLASRAGIQLGRLPGDIRIQTGGVTCLVPIATTIVLSIVLTIVLNIILRLLSK